MNDNNYCFLGRASLGIYILSLMLKGKFAVPINICADVIEAIYLGGSEIEFIDLDFDLEPNYSKISDTCNVIIISNIYGIKDTLPEFKENQIVIDDACQMIVGEDLNSGYRGDIGIFSFKRGKIFENGCGVIWFKDHYLQKEFKLRLEYEYKKFHFSNPQKKINEVYKDRKNLINKFRKNSDPIIFQSAKMVIDNIIIPPPSDHEIFYSRKILGTKNIDILNIRLEKTLEVSSIARSLGFSLPNRFDDAIWRMPFYVEMENFNSSNIFFNKCISKNVYLSSWYLPGSWWFKKNLSTYKYLNLWKSLYQIPLGSQFDVLILKKYLSICHNIKSEHT